MPDGWTEFETPAGRAAIDPSIGNLRRLAFRFADRIIEPLHTAPWIDEPDVLADEDLLPVERQLAGDFFCAPFGASDVEPAPAHGWSANSRWTGQDRDDGGLLLTLDRQVMGATITKSLRLSADAPLLYQEHLIAGGTGGLTVAHHPMIRLGDTGRLSFSPKRTAITPDEPLDAGRNRLACPAACNDPTRFPNADRGVTDLTRLPIGSRTEDFVSLVEAEQSRLGWTAIVRDREDDIVFFLKDPSVLPVTMFWHSNGGRDYAPWNGRHSGVLGIEDGCAAGSAGHRAALGPNPIASHGVPTYLALAPGRTHRVAHVVGALPRPPGWSRITDIATLQDMLVLTEENGETRTLPFQPSFLTEARSDGNG